MITFDLPLWLKSVDIVLSQNLPIIPQLEGCYLLKSFLGTFSAIFADSELCDIVQVIYPGEIAASLTETVMTKSSEPIFWLTQLSFSASLLQTYLHIWRDL